MVGTCRRSPMSNVSTIWPLASFNSLSVISYWRAMPYHVSPATTSWVAPLQTTVFSATNNFFAAGIQILWPGVSGAATLWLASVNSSIVRLFERARRAKVSPGSTVYHDWALQIEVHKNNHAMHAPINGLFNSIFMMAIPY